MPVVLLITFLSLTNLFAADGDGPCADLFLDKERIQKILAEKANFSPDVLDQAAYVDAELVVFNQTERAPVVYVYAPGREAHVFVASPDGGEVYLGSKFTTFVMSGDKRLAILDPGGWRDLQNLPQRDPGLKAFYAEHADALETLIARWGYDTRDLLAARVHHGESYSILSIRGEQFGRPVKDLWVMRTHERAFTPVASLFAGVDGEAAFDLSDGKSVFRLIDAETGQYEYKIVDSITRQLGKARDPGLIRLIHHKSALLTRFTLGKDDKFVERLLASEAWPAWYDGTDLEARPTVFVLHYRGTGYGKHGEALAVVDEELDLAAHERHFQTVRHLVLSNGRRLNAKRTEDRWHIEGVSSRGTLDQLRKILDAPVAGDHLRAIGVKLR